MKVIVLTLFFLLTTGVLFGADAHTLFTEILEDYVKDGHVNYKALKGDVRLDSYLKQLEGSNPDRLPGKNAKLAFWMNAYNAYTLKVIVDNYPVKSINDLHGGGLVFGTILGTTVWDSKFIKINGKKYSLNMIEHEIIRPVFQDSRIHFALVCAAFSCPPLRSEAYEANRVDAQLDDQAVTFLQDKTRNRFDVDRKKAELSEILNWYRGDFGNDNRQLLLSIVKYLPSPAAASIKRDPGKWNVSNLPYNWDLNE